jgi:AraC family ethanolamine operon transcriptional activator
MVCDIESSRASRPIRAERIATNSVEECDARLNAASPFVRHDQMEGSFAAEIVRITGPERLKVSLASYGAAVTSSGASPDRTYSFCLPASDPTGARWNHRPIRPNEVTVLRPSEEFRLYRPAGFQSVVLCVDEAIVDRCCEDLFGLPPSRVLGRTQRLAGNGEAVALHARQFAQTCEVASRNAKPLNDWAAAHGGPAGLAAELVQEIFATMAEPTRKTEWPARSRIVERAWKAVDDREEMPTVGSLCLTLGVPVRTLSDAFHACVGISPKRFISGVQLNKVHRELSRPHDATTVTAVATRFGFYHFGHFGTQYRRLFGESPHRTLLNARAQAHGFPYVHRLALH